MKTFAITAGVLGLFVVAAALGASIQGEAPVPDCYLEGFYRLPHEECDKYWICLNHTASLGQCSYGLYWNTVKQTCDFPENTDTENCIEPDLTTASSSISTTQESSTVTHTTTSRPSTSTEQTTTTTTELITTTTTEEATTTTTEEATTTTTEGPTTTESSLTTFKPVCDSAGTSYYPADDCDKYWVCSNGVPVLNQCSPGLYWNDDLSTCDFPANVDTSNCNEV